MKDSKLFDDETLKQLGINKDGAEKEALVATLNQTLEERVGLALYDLLDDDQASEFMKLADAGKPEDVNDWLKQHIPDYQAVIEDEYYLLLGELSDNASLV